jgi:hypothetical protein
LESLTGFQFFLYPINIDTSDMTNQKLLVCIVFFFTLAAACRGQQISKEELIFLTPEWKGERFKDGRPKVPDEILKRMKLVTLEEAWAVLKNENFKQAYDDGWMCINPDSVLVGRALIYGELYFGKTRPKTCKTFDKKGLVLHCASFSKSLAPGFRIGWAIPGRFKERVISLKRMHTVSTNTVTQAALASFLNNGRFELHLRHLRKALYTQSLRYLQAIAEHFPEDTRVTRPQGGFTLWIEMNKKINAYKLHKRALKHKIGIAPGQIFSSQGRFENCFRISYGAPWSEQVGQGLQTLGKLIHEMH